MKNAKEINKLEDKKNDRKLEFEFEGEIYEGFENSGLECEGCDLENVDCCSICLKITEENYIWFKKEGEKH